MEKQNVVTYEADGLDTQVRLEIVAAALRAIGIRAFVRQPTAAANYRPRSLRQIAQVEG
jgi:hypothetical protein